MLIPIKLLLMMETVKLQEAYLLFQVQESLPLLLLEQMQLIVMAILLQTSLLMQMLVVTTTT